MKTLALARFLFLLLCIVFLNSCDEESDPVITPVTNGDEVIQDVSFGTLVYSIPQVKFTMAIGEPVVVEGNNFRPVLDEFLVRNGSTIISGTVIHATDKKSISFHPDELWPANTTLSYLVRAHWEQEINSNWVPVKIGSEAHEELIEGTVQISAYTPPAEMIAGVYPTDQSVKQPGILVPFIALSQKPEQIVTKADNPFQYKLVTEGATFKKGNESIANTVRWNAQKDSVFVLLESPLASLTSYTMTVNAHWEVKRAEEWKPLKMNGANVSESRSFTFTTDHVGNPSMLLGENITHTYPVNRQYHFLQDESPTGYIILKGAQQNSLLQVTGAEQLKVKFTPAGESAFYVNANFNATMLAISYTVPDLVNEKIYKIQLMKIAGPNEQVLYTNNFRTSKFNTFNDKMNSYTVSQAATWFIPGGGADELWCALQNGPENFDFAEAMPDSVSVTNSTVPLRLAAGLVQFEALPNNVWYDNMYSLIYQHLPEWKFKVQRRSTTKIGVPPTNAIHVKADAQTKRGLDDIQILMGTAPTITGAPQITYNLGLAAAVDMADFQSQAANSPLRETMPSMKLLSEKTFPGISKGSYKVKVKYVLPGQKTATSEKEIVLQYN